MNVDKLPAALAPLLLFGFGLVPYAWASCTLGRVAEAPIVMVGLRPTMTARINGADASFLVDSGAFFSSLSRASAAQFNLRLSPAPAYLKVWGVGGVTTELSLTTIKSFSLFGVDLANVEFLVGGSEVGANAAGILGQNILHIADVEYDLANGVIRLMQAKGCEKSALAYWSGTQPFSEMDIQWATPRQPHTIGVAYLNGVKIHVVFDTGAALSVVTLRGARRAGVRTDGADVLPAGLSYGIGRQAVRSWVAPVESFKIGAEEIKHTHLRLGDFDLPIADMLIGADFFLSHRIYVASSQRKLYFTYNGGPVFDLRKQPEAAHATAAAGPSEPVEPGKADVSPDLRNAAEAGQSEKAAEGSRPVEGAEHGDVTSGEPGEAGEPKDAAAFSRRGLAFAARRDYQRAINDLTRACELDPQQPGYFFERGQVHARKGEPALALTDFDQALQLNPDSVPARLARAELQLAAHALPSARIDLDNAARVAPRQADMRLHLGQLYVAAGQLESAIREYDLWMEFHRDDVRVADALAGRCSAGLHEC
jgi:predicted aspartyl protease